MIKELLQGNEVSLLHPARLLEQACTALTVVSRSEACVHEMKPAASMHVLQLVEVREEHKNGISCSAAP